MPTEIFPNTAFLKSGRFSVTFAEYGCVDFRNAAAYVQQLPYGRNSGSPAFEYVLIDSSGTCSSKHALIASLAEELGLDVALILGIYEMNKKHRALAKCWRKLGYMPSRRRIVGYVIEGRIQI